MEEENIFFDYENQPGKIEEKIDMPKGEKPKISIITSYYNADKYIEQTYNTVVSQTFPYWEWIIVDDGSTSEVAKLALEEIAKKDSRIFVYHKENEGLAKGRDFAIQKATTNYIFPLDADDLIDKTILECSFWALETFPEAVWAYTNIVGFEGMIYLDARKFDIEKMKTDNQITATALIRREKIEELGGYSKAARHINEDWHLWLRMLQKGYFPVHMRFYGFWYRRKEKGSLLKQINNPNNKLRIEAIANEASKITQNIEAIELPRTENFKISKLDYSNFPKLRSNGVLIIAPHIKTDKHVLEIAKKEKNVTILTTTACPYIGRKWCEEVADVFDMTTFLAEENYMDFIKYIIKTRDIKKVYLCNQEIELDEQIEIIKENYVEDESEYAIYEKKYKQSKTILGKIARRIKRRLSL